MQYIPKFPTTGNTMYKGVKHHVIHSKVSNNRQYNVLRSKASCTPGRGFELAILRVRMSYLDQFCEDAANRPNVDFGSILSVAD
jgi:hypothetical protein